MSKEPAFAEQYKLNMQAFFDKKYAEGPISMENSIKRCWYLPHFGVTNPNKPGKLRIVFDAAATSNGVSLNSMLLTGPDLLNPILDILFRFREFKVGLSADIREMFPPKLKYAKMTEMLNVFCGEIVLMNPFKFFEWRL